MTIHTVPLVGIGDYVTPISSYRTNTFHGVYRVTKVNPKTLALEPIGADARQPVRADARLVEKVGAEKVNAALRAQVTTPAKALPRVGAVVRAKHPKIDSKALWVVVKVTDKVNIYPLGGDDSGRYWRMLPANVTVVEHGTF